MFSSLRLYFKKLFKKEQQVRAHIVVKGRVFDGSYHIYVEQQARNYRLNGWLKVRDGLSANAFLELEVEAPDPTLQRFLIDLRKGTRDSHVTLVTVEMKAAGNPPLSGFSRLL